MDAGWKQKGLVLLNPKKLIEPFGIHPIDKFFSQKLYSPTRPLTFFHTKFFISRVSLQLFLKYSTLKYKRKTSKDFYPRFYSLYSCPILNLEKEPVFPFSMLVLNKGTTGTIFIKVFGMTRSLTGDWTWDLYHSSTLPLGFQGGGT